MSMPKFAPAIALALMLAACGAVPGGQGNLPAPPPPTAALAKWSTFPVNAKPRPIIWFGDIAEKIGEGQFTSEAGKEAWVCRKFSLADGVRLSSSSSATGSARWPSGRQSSYSTIGSAPAFAGITAQQGGNPDMCKAAKPFTITGVRIDTATFSTDRGGADMSAWVFEIPEINSSIAYPALDPSAYWGGRAYTADTQGLGAKISGDGKTLTIGLVGGPERGACGIDYTAAAAESSTAVAVAIKAYPHDTNAVCDLVGYGRTVSIVLKAPLGDRVLLDENGNVGTASP
jgi:hypothetical protein